MGQVAVDLGRFLKLLRAQRGLSQEELAERAGLSVRPLAEGRTPTSWRDALVVEGRHCRALHTDRFKYTVYDIGDRREMLVDIQNDPGEMKNLAEDPTCRDTLLDCRKRLRQWYRDHGETLAPGYVVA